MVDVGLAVAVLAFLARALPALLEKALLVAHLFSLVMAHYRCATINTPLVTNSYGAPLVRHWYPR